MGFNTLTGMSVITVLVNKITYINVGARYKIPECGVTILSM